MLSTYFRESFANIKIHFVFNLIIEFCRKKTKQLCSLKCFHLFKNVFYDIDFTLVHCNTNKAIARKHKFSHLILLGPRISLLNHFKCQLPQPRPDFVICGFNNTQHLKKVMQAKRYRENKIDSAYAVANVCILKSLTNISQKRTYKYKAFKT